MRDTCKWEAEEPALGFGLWEEETRVYKKEWGIWLRIYNSRLTYETGRENGPERFITPKIFIVLHPIYK